MTASQMDVVEPSGSIVSELATDFIEVAMSVDGSFKLIIKKGSAYCPVHPQGGRPEDPKAGGEGLLGQIFISLS